MGELSAAARAYILAFLAGGLALAVLSGARPPTTFEQAALCLVLAVLGALSQLFEVRTPNNKAYVVTPLFLLAGALLLPPLALVVATVVPFAVEQARKPKQWYIPAFNAASHVLATLGAASASAGVLHLLGSGAFSHDDPMPAAVAAVAACAVFLVVNHASTIGVLFLARGVPPRESGLFAVEGVLTDSCLLFLGVVLAFLWDAGPLLALFVLVPVALIQRALHFPALQQASRTDPKTGLFNAAYFRESAEAELARAERAGARTSVLVADLDYLRKVNNTYGHLAGDLVLAGVADVLREEVREYDVVARFGGEEFAILLPDTPQEEALAIAERIRARVAARRFHLATAGAPVSVTLSLGVASAPEHGHLLDAVLHRADLAVYRAKVEGRDRVCATDADDTPG